MNMGHILNERISDKLACVMIEGVGLVIGKLNKEVTVIKNPRIIQTSQQGMRLSPMLGDPDELVLVRPPVFGYKILNKELKDVYVQATTGLVIANSLPNVPVPPVLGVVK